MKVALCLEEMGLAYEPKPIDTRKGEQHEPDFLGRVANSGVGHRMGCARRQFHTLLTSGRPKQSASRRFCSHTVHAPAKPKPLRSHSIASKPWIVRRAVWKAWKQPIRGMGRLTRKWSLSIPCCRCLVT